MKRIQEEITKQTGKAPVVTKPENKVPRQEHKTPVKESKTPVKEVLKDLSGEVSKAIGLLREKDWKRKKEGLTQLEGLLSSSHKPPG